MAGLSGDGSGVVWVVASVEAAGRACQPSRAFTFLAVNAESRASSCPRWLMQVTGAARAVSCSWYSSVGLPHALTSIAMKRWIKRSLHMQRSSLSQCAK